MDQHDTHETVPSPPKLMGGLLLIALGLIFLAQGHDWLFGWHFSFGRLWPVLLIVMGLVRLGGASGDTSNARTVTVAGPPGRTPSDAAKGGVGLIFVGVIMLLHTNDILSLSQSWPLFIVWAGVMVLFSRRPAPVGPKASDTPPPGTTQP